MEYLRKINRELLLLSFVVILASFLRFLWLDKVPNAIGGDELIYSITAKSIALTGSDLTNTWNPISVFLFNYPPNQMQAELPYFLLLPFAKFFSLSLLSVKPSYALMSIFTVLLIYLITKNLTNKNVGIIAGFIAAINPWFIYIGRTDYEMVPATLFFLAGLYLLLIGKGKTIFISILFLFAGFYSYIGTKIIFFPFVLTTVLYSYFYISEKKYLKQYLLVLGLCFALVLFFALFVKNNSNSRLNEIISFNDVSISKQVDYLRKNSIENPLTNLLESKPVVFSNIIATKFFNTTSFNYLFREGDKFFSIQNHGLFYILDFVFLVLGFAFMFAKQRKAAVFVVVLSLISIIPHLLHGARTDNFTPHISLLFPFLIIFISYGIWEIISFKKQKNYFIISLLIIFFLYLISVLSFLNIYFYQFPLIGKFDFPVREVSKYVSISPKNQKIIVYTPRSYDVYTKYLFYSGRLNKENISSIQSSLKNKEHRLSNITFVSCNNTIDFSKTKDIIVYDFNCGAHPGVSKHLAITNFSDGGTNYEIYNDKICSGFSLKPYPSGIKISDFSIENQGKQKFCETFITSR